MFKPNYYIISIMEKVVFCMWSSDQRHRPDQHLQQPQQSQQPDGEENIYVNGDVVAGSTPDIIYAQIGSNRARTGTEGRGKGTSPSKDNGAVIYSDLQSIDAPTHTAAPSRDLYANVKRR